MVLWSAVLGFALGFSQALVLSDHTASRVKLQPHGSTVPCSLCPGSELQSQQEEP